MVPPRPAGRRALKGVGNNGAGLPDCIVEPAAVPKCGKAERSARDSGVEIKNTFVSAHFIPFYAYNDMGESTSMGECNDMGPSTGAGLRRRRSGATQSWSHFMIVACHRGK